MEDWSSKTDEELLENLKTNDDVFGLLIDRYQERLDRYIDRISSFSKEDREDLLQEIFLAVYQNVYSFDSRLKFSSWIYRITHNQTISRWRKHRQEQDQISLEDNVFLVERIFNENDVLKNLEEKENVELIQGACQKLPHKYREILVLRFMEEKSYDEISDILKIPVSTVGTLIRRAKEKIKKEL